MELAELTRNVLKDWIPIFEENHLVYEIEIPERPLFAKVDLDGYARIINNLAQNVITHSQATQIKIVMSKRESEIHICIEDNGIGVEKSDLQHIFDRLYKCDKGRSAKWSLEGKRKYGVDHYTGAYTADYEDFSGTEYLFGGTSIDREAGNEIEITCKLNITNGTAKLALQSGSEDPQILIECTGEYSETLNYHLRATILS